MDQPGIGLAQHAGRRHERLEVLRAQLIADLAAVESELTATRAIRANGSDDDEHDPEGIPLSSVLHSLEGQRVRIVDQSRAVDVALAGLARGSHGICTSCSGPIGAGRLEIKPYAATCVRCAR